MKKLLTVLLCLLWCFSCACAETPAAGETAPDYTALLADMRIAYFSPTEENIRKLNTDADRMNDPLARSIADQWISVWLDPEYRLSLYGADDPAQLPVRGRHAFVVLGFQLMNGEMTDELMGRCQAAAAAASAFPDSILVCTGGATGSNNPEKHTEAGMMKAYLSEECGIAPERILTDEKARTTLENAVNTMAILQEQHIETITIVTSAYHQKRGQTLYNAVSGMLGQASGYSVEIVGNYSWPTGNDEQKEPSEMNSTLYQLAAILVSSSAAAQ